jgi:uncharacterized protein YheU (UPF0270 family)
VIPVPPDNLRPNTLQVLIEGFVTRDGAVHGHSDTPLDVMVIPNLSINQKHKRPTGKAFFDHSRCLP